MHWKFPLTVPNQGFSDASQCIVPKHCQEVLDARYMFDFALIFGYCTFRTILTVAHPPPPPHIHIFGYMTPPGVTSHSLWLWVTGSQSPVGWVRKGWAKFKGRKKLQNTERLTVYAVFSQQPGERALTFHCRNMASFKDIAMFSLIWTVYNISSKYYMVLHKYK